MENIIIFGIHQYLIILRLFLVWTEVKVEAIWKPIQFDGALWEKS